MSWTVVLEGEHQDPIASLSDQFYTRVALDPQAFRLLCYLDPYGNTTFNYLQVPDLLQDLALLLSWEPHPLGNELLALVEWVKLGQHMYVCFYGD